MDRNIRDARRPPTASTTITPPSSNGLPRRRHRTSLRDSPEDDGPLELPDTLRNGLRDRHVGGKKDRGERIERLDRPDRDRDQDRERMLRNKRRRGDGNNNHWSIHHGGSGGRGDELGVVADDSSEESVNDNEDDDEDEHQQQQQHIRLLQPSSAVTSSASALLNNSRRSYPPLASGMGAAAAAPKVARPSWKVADEMIGVSVPRKARSASTKRSHDCWVGGGATTSYVCGASGDQALQQPSTSPVRTGLAAGSPVNNRPLSPSSSNASARKKLKPNGPKQRPPQSVSKPVSSSATQDEIEIAEVLYGMMRQPQGPSLKSEVSYGGESVKMEISRDENSKLLPVSHSGSLLPPQNSSTSVPLTAAVAPKRKKPRQMKYDEDTRVQSMYPVRKCPITAKLEMDTMAMAKHEVSPSSEKARGSGIENGGAYEPGNTQGMPILSENLGGEGRQMEGFLGSSKREGSMAVGDGKEEFTSSKKEPGMLLSGSDVRADGKIDSKRNPADAEAENHQEEKFKIDLMAPPPARPSPERDFVGNFPGGLDQKSISSNEEGAEEGGKTAVKVGSVTTSNKEVGAKAGEEGVKREAEGEGRKSGGGGDKEKKGVSVSLQLDGGGGVNMMMVMGNPSPHANASAGSKGNPPGPKLQQQQQPVADKSAPSASSLTFPIPVAGWHGGLPPPIGYMPPLPGVVSMDGSAVAPAALQPPQFLFSQPRPERCATHCYIARSISYHQQMARIPFWPAAAGPVPRYGAKPCNVNVMPSADPNGNASARCVNALPDKGQNLGLFPSHSGKDKASPAANGLESQRKPILLQQAIPPGAPGNILHGPAFIFPVSQQQAVAAAAAASARSGPSKSTNGNGAAPVPSTAAGSASASSLATSAATAAAAMSFSYPNMPGGETQYLAILPNNSYPFPVPAHVGAASSAYRGTHPQAMPFLNGPFYPSQMLHPTQLQQQLLSNLPQMQQVQGHHNASNSSSSSTSLKHSQSHQHVPLGSVSSGSGGSLQVFPSGKIQPSPQINQQPPHQVRPSESEAAGEDNPSTADGRIPRGNMTSIYGQNFPTALHAPNFSLMTQAPTAGANGASSNNTAEKKQQPQLASHHNGSKPSAADSLPSPAFAMSFANMGSSASSTHGLDISSFAQSHAVLQSLPEATRQTYQIMAVAAAAAAAAQNAQQKKNARVSDDGKVGGNDASNDEDRKPLCGKISTTGGQSIAFSRPDLMDASVSSLPGSNVVDSSIRTLNHGSGSSRASASAMPSPQQLQRSHQQMFQLQKQHQFAAAAAAAARSKTPAASNVSVYSDHLGASTSAAAKYPSSSSFPQNLIQSGNGQTQSQWRGSTRLATSSVPSSLAPLTTTTTSVKLHSQQSVRVPQGQTHISFANGNSKSSSASQGQQQIPTTNQQSPSPTVVVGSPTTSSVSKSGSPRTTTSSTSNKPVQAASSLQMQHVKNSSQSHKSSSVGSGNVPSILGNSPLTSSSGQGAKHQLPQQQLLKQTLPQAQLFFSHPYVPVPAPHSSMNSASAVSATNAYYMQRRPSEQQPKLQQHSQGPASSSASAKLSLCPPVTLTTSGTCDPVKAVTASNMKGGNLQSQGILHAVQFSVTQSSGGSHQIVPAGFSYVHSVPGIVQVKPAEQKQPADCKDK
ncbi:hypothetical protein MLD38_039626 [Melastoma candidum]|uniref:Uncharacterized protein n=1 Tax=Melastoma candidum TaxID=119954 RepID=A0ACB9L516_9MYRT|nr:hypothetical protein MLD38_039626 [Melastoma candidum]